MKNISILGATGSIGTQTLDVIRNSEDEIKLNRNYSKYISRKNERHNKRI